MNIITDILSYEFNQRALLVAIMIGFMNGYVGGYVVLKRGALFAGSLSHTLFPGIALGALIAGLNPYSALIGAFIMAMLIGLSAEGIAANWDAISSPEGETQPQAGFEQTVKLTGKAMEGLGLNK